MQSHVSPARVAAAREVARRVRQGMPQLEHGHRTSRENDNFVPEFFNASRLHFIGSWKNRYSLILDSLPPPPPLPSPRPESCRWIAHIDMDCFFASVAARGRPELDGLPVAVAWSESSGEIASCNYTAREFGVRASMWMPRARELCPHIIVMPYEFEAYEATAESMYRTVFETTPHVMGVSVDECFADFTELTDPEAAATDLRARIYARTGCIASIGLAPSRLLARLATKRAKPDGMCIVRR